MSDDTGLDPYFSFGLRDVFISAILVEGFMAGIYTMLAIYTASLMFSNPKFLSSNKWLMSCLLLLYMFTITHFAIQWVFTRQVYVLNGDTADNILNAILDEPLGQVMASSTLNTAATILSDCILVWRCWVIWNRNWFSIILPLVTLTAELGTGIFNLVQQAEPLTAANITADPATIYLSLSLVTTVITTLLIVYRIVRLGHFSKTSPYKNIIEIVCESAVLYSLALILFIPLYVQTDLHLNFMSEYLKRVVVGLTGIAPTLIICRVAMGVGRTTDGWSQAATATYGSSSSTTKFSAAGGISSKEIEIRKYNTSTVDF